MNAMMNEIQKEEKSSCFLIHTLDLPLPVELFFKIMSDPTNWPIINFPTAIRTDILKKLDNYIEFKLEESVGKKSYISHLHFHICPENYFIHYYHESPVFPFIKYMKMRWYFKDIGNGWTRYIIAREYDLKIPIINKLIGMTIMKRIIKKHVADYAKELLEFARNVNYIKVYKDYHLFDNGNADSVKSLTNLAI
jgi:hypothetical protein